MNLFDINEAIRSKLEEIYEQVDEDGCFTGDFSEIEELNLERDAKIENLALYYKETVAEAVAIKAEADKLAKRAKVAENKANRLKEYLAFILNSAEVEKFSTPTVKISFRSSESVVIDNELKIPNEYLTLKQSVQPDKTAIKEAIKNGTEIEGAHLEIKQNIQIK